jgi:hypothetical protein
MEQEVFILLEVTEFYNTNFINHCVNAEKGEGLGIASLSN